MKRWTLFVVVLLLILSLACSFGKKVPASPEPAQSGGEVTPAASSSGGTSAGGEATTEPSGNDEGEAPTFSAEELEGLDSYRSRISFRTASEDGSLLEEGEIFLEETREPRASHMIISGLGDEDTMEMITIGQDQWIKIGDEWMYAQASPDETDEFGSGLIFSPEEIFSEISEEGYEYVGKEKLDGFKTKHYRYDMTGNAATTLAGATALSDIEEGTIDVWVADESNLPEFPVKVVINVKGKNDDGQTVTETITMEITDINADITIEPPTDAEANPFGDLPPYPNATNVSIFGGMLSFQTSDDVGTVQAFYEEALSQAGWTKGESSEMEGMVMEDWTKDGESLSVMITADENGGCSVMLMKGE